MTTTHEGPDTRTVWRVPRVEWAPFGLGLAFSILMSGAPATLLTFAGLDASWALGLNVARANDFQFGQDLIFSYGPWGYLDHPAPLGDGLFGIALLYSVLAVAGLFVTSYVALRRRWDQSPVAAAACAAAITAILGATVEASALALAACAAAALIHAVTLAEGARRVGTITLLPVAIAVVAGLLVQVKVSVGVAAAVIAFLTALGDLSIRRLVVDTVATGAAFIASFLLFWSLAGQQFQWLPEWVRGSMEIVRGYPEAMAFERADGLLGYLVGLVLAIFVVVQCVRLARRVGVRRAAVPTLLAAALGVFAFKAAFTRHDDHELTFFALVTAILLSLAPLARHRWSGVVALVGALVMVMPGATWLDVRQARDEWRVAMQIALVEPSAEVYYDRGKEQGRATYQLPEEFVTAIADHPVSVDPYDVALAIDYDMTWHPLPVFQAYSAYTPYLDRLNARAARSAPADQLMLRIPTASIDARNPRWETPEYTLTLACEYTQQLSDGLWSLMRHDEPRCSGREEVGRQHVTANESATVPPARPDELVLAQFQPDSTSIPARLGHTIFKDWGQFAVEVDDESFQLPEALAGGPLIVSYPDRGAQGLFPAYHYDQISFSVPGTLTFNTVHLDAVAG